MELIKSLIIHDLSISCITFKVLASDPKKKQKKEKTNHFSPIFIELKICLILFNYIC